MTTPPNTPTNTATTKPAHTLRLGLLQAAIWSNAGPHGPFFNVTFERRYRDAKEEWQSSNSFSRDDLLLLAKLADQAHSWITDQRSQEHEHRSPEADANATGGRAGPRTRTSR
jgi:hypothetical protein